MELYRNIYRDRPEVLSEIDTFEAALRQLPEFLFLSTSEFEQKSRLFKFMIARSRGQDVERNIRVADITALVNDSRILSSIRLEAINLLDSLSTDLNTLERNQASVALIAALEQDRSPNVRAQAATALTKLGGENALEALQLASTDDESPEVRTAANAALLALRSPKPAAAPMIVPKTVQPAEFAYTIIEYPARREVTIPLTAVNIAATGVATVLRDDDGTRINLNLANVPADLTALTLYAVDDEGRITALGPVAISNGTGTLAATIPLSRFMLVVSPEPALTAYDRNTRILFKSAVPEGFAVIPVRSNPSGEKVAAVSAPSVTPSGAPSEITYTAPLLNIPAFKKGDDTKIKVDFTGALTGARAVVFITPQKDGPTEVKMRFHDLKEAPAGQKFVLWAVAPDGVFQKLGQVVNTPGRNEAEVRSETRLPDFGLVVTMESGDHYRPEGPAVAHVHIVP